MKQFYSLCMIMLLASVLAIDVMGQKTLIQIKKIKLFFFYFPPGIFSPNCFFGKKHDSDCYR